MPLRLLPLSSQPSPSSLPFSFFCPPQKVVACVKQFGKFDIPAQQLEEGRKRRRRKERRKGEGSKDGTFINRKERKPFLSFPFFGCKLI